MFNNDFKTLPEDEQKQVVSLVKVVATTLACLYQVANNFPRVDYNTLKTKIDPVIEDAAKEALKV